jgi:hypothetical protein
LHPTSWCHSPATCTCNSHRSLRLRNKHSHNLPRKIVAQSPINPIARPLSLVHVVPHSDLFLNYGFRHAAVILLTEQLFTTFSTFCPIVNSSRSLQLVFAFSSQPLVASPFSRRFPFSLSNFGSILRNPSPLLIDPTSRVECPLDHPPKSLRLWNPVSTSLLDTLHCAAARHRAFDLLP